MLRRYSLTIAMLAVLGFTSGCLFTAIPKHFPFPDAAPVKLSSRAPHTKPMLAKRTRAKPAATVIASAPKAPEPKVQESAPLLAAVGASAEVETESDVPYLVHAWPTAQKPFRKPLPKTSSRPHAKPPSARTSTTVASRSSKSFLERAFSSTKRSSLDSLGRIPDHPVARYSEFQSYLRCVHGAAVDMDDNRRPVGSIVRNAIGQCGHQKSVAVNALSYPGMTGKVVVRAVDNGVYTLTLSKLLSRRLNL